MLMDHKDLSFQMFNYIFLKGEITMTKNGLNMERLSSFNLTAGCLPSSFEVLNNFVS